MTVISDLKRHEGFRSKPYRDTKGNLTIGYGFNLDAGMSEEEATMLLIYRVRKIECELVKRLYYFSSLSQNRRNVLVNMGYNLGIDGLMEFDKTLKYIEEGEFKLASEEMLKSKWYNDVGRRAKELAETMERG